MVEPTSELILKILKEIQETQGEHTRRFDDHTRRFERIEHRLDEVHEGMITALGLAGHAHVRHDMVSERLDDLTRRMEVLERTK